MGEEWGTDRVILLPDEYLARYVADRTGIDDDRLGPVQAALPLVNKSRKGCEAAGHDDGEAGEGRCSAGGGENHESDPD